MNNNMAINIYLSQLNLKNKLRKREEERQNHVCGEGFDGCQMGEECGGKKEVRGLRSTNRWLQNSHGDVKYSTGNGVAKALTRMTHGHEQQWGDCLWEWGR